VSYIDIEACRYDVFISKYLDIEHMDNISLDAMEVEGGKEAYYA